MQTLIRPLISSAKFITSLLPSSFRRHLRWQIAYSVEKRLSKSLPEDPVRLRKEHLENCVLVPDRYQLLELLPKNSVVAEIGVYQGGFSDEIFKRTNPAKLFLIDSWEREMKPYKNIVTLRFKDEIEQDRIQVVHSDSLSALARFEDGFFDWVYLDSDHSYEHTLKELMLLKTKVKQDGLIVGHDYTKGNWYAWIRLGVIEAVNEFCVKENYEFLHFTLEPSMYFSFSLKRKSSESLISNL